jgi:hypothetical protein
LTGKDVNSNYDQSASRWIINFGEMTLEEAQNYSECFNIVKEKVKPDRDKAKRKANREKWWRYAETRPGLSAALLTAKSVYVQPFVSKYIVPIKVDKSQIFASPMVVIAVDGDKMFPYLQSSIHDVFVRNLASDLGGTLRYAPTDCFETFPFPKPNDDLENIGQQYHEYRQSIMKTRQEGLTATYNRFHDPKESSPDIQKLRELHIQMDNAVANAYGWNDLDLEHGYHETRQGIRFTISETARREVLDRLLRLNHERYAQEIALGHHDTGKKKKAPAKRKAKKKNAQDTKQGGLF